MLRVENLSSGYGEVPVLTGVSLEVNKGEIVSLVGSNGAGKSTLLRTISGLLKPAAGEIHLEDHRIDRLASHEIVRMGLAHVPEGRRLFGKLSVMDNLLLGAYCTTNQRLIDERLRYVCSLFPVLGERRTQKAETMSGGEQQMLAIGRALMTGPRVLMLDEPSLGLMPKYVTLMLEAVVKMKESGIAVLLVEQNVKKAMEVADRVYVLQTGRIVLSGTAAECGTSDLIRKAYLGM